MNPAGDGNEYGAGGIWNPDAVRGGVVNPATGCAPPVDGGKDGALFQEEPFRSKEKVFQSAAGESGGIFPPPGFYEGRGTGFAARGRGTPAVIYLLHDILGNEVHFLLRNAELPGGRLPEVGGEVLPPYLHRYGAEAQGAGGRPLQDFLLGVKLGVD